MNYLSENEIPLNHSSDERSVEKFVKRILKNNTFIGNYVEQRFVPLLERYKKIVKISSTEDNFIENLSVVKTRIQKFYGSSRWIGITFPNEIGAPAGFNLWVDFDEEVLGEYQFSVKGVKFSDNEICLKIKPTNLNSYNQTSEDERPHTKFGNQGMVYWKDKIVSWKNTKQCFHFIFLLVLSMVAASGQLIMFLSDYILKLIRELAHMIQVTTPIFVAFIETIGKMFGYICFMIAMVFKKQPPVYSQNLYPKQLVYQSRYQSIEPMYPYDRSREDIFLERRKEMTALNYKKGGVQITEIYD